MPEEGPIYGLMIPPAVPRPAAAAARPRLPLRSWRAAGRMQDRAGGGLAAAARAGLARTGAAGLAWANAVALARSGRLLPPVRLARRLRPRSRFLAEAEVLLVAR